jgi:hypothetical protein
MRPATVPTDVPPEMPPIVAMGATVSVTAAHQDDMRSGFDWFDRQRQS